MVDREVQEHPELWATVREKVLDLARDTRKLPEAAGVVTVALGGKITKGAKRCWRERCFGQQQERSILEAGSKSVLHLLFYKFLAYRCLEDVFELLVQGMLTASVEHRAKMEKWLLLWCDQCNTEPTTGDVGRWYTCRDHVVQAIKDTIERTRRKKRKLINLI